MSDKHSPLRYHLRFQIPPGPNVRQEANILADFCRDRGVEEVVLFFAGEEWNDGLLSRADEDRWFETVRDASEVLTAAGIVCSLNPWMTVLHTDRGRTFPADRSFSSMVSPLGEETAACASFADPAWRKYIAEVYGRFAELGFRVLWVEDDYRFHNHAPLEWGGGFEPEVIDRFCAKIERSATREEIVEAILMPGPPHPWRSLWMETWREVHLEVAHIITGAVGKRSSGNSQIGLMTSSPSSHSIEGRRWDSFYDAFSIDGEFVHRPHFAGYQESPPQGRASSFLMLELQRSLRPRNVEVAPEIENFPFTAWNKSDTQTWCEMAIALVYGSDALLLDLYPFAGNPPPDEPQIGDLLDASRPGLEWIAERFLTYRSTAGIGIPWRDDAAERVHTTAGRSMSELGVDPFAAGDFLLRNGLPMTAEPSGTNALFGSIAWVFDDDELRNMLAGGLLLDGESAAILVERGFGESIGVESVTWLERESSRYAMEQIADPATGVREGLLLNMNLAPRVAQLRLAPQGTTAWTRIVTPQSEDVGPGVVACENEGGGRVVTFAVPNPGELPQNYHRQKIVHAAAEFVAGDAGVPLRVTGSPHLMPVDFRDGNSRAIVVLNGATDPGKPTIHVADTPGSEPTVTLLAPLAEPERIDATVEPAGSGVTIKPAAEIPSQGFVVVEW